MGILTIFLWLGLKLTAKIARAATDSGLFITLKINIDMFLKKNKIINTISAHA
jgi:hypothetical protein